MRAVKKPTRPVLRYHGGKWRLAPWIISHFPDHHIYVEPFSGAPQDWASYPDCISAFTSRLVGVLVENINALDVIPRHDTPDTLFYVDPPYPKSTRSSINYGGEKGQYLHEMTDDDHRALARVLLGVVGMVVLSGYHCALYDEELYSSWHRVEREALADGGQTRVEVLWINDNAWQRLRYRQIPLIGRGATC